MSALSRNNPLASRSCDIKKFARFDSQQSNKDWNKVTGLSLIVPNDVKADDVT